MTRNMRGKKSKQKNVGGKRTGAGRPVPSWIVSARKGTKFTAEVLVKKRVYMDKTAGAQRLAYHARVGNLKRVGHGEYVKV